MYVLPLSVMAVLVFAAIAMAQSVPEGLDADQNTTGVQNSTSVPGKAPAQSTTPAQSSAPAPNSSVTVDIHDHTFDPAQLNIAPGTTVTWTNGDTEAHTVTADNGLFDSGVIEPGQSYSSWLGGSGMVAYHCEIHPDMKGSVVVGGASEGRETSRGNPASSTPPVQTATPRGDPVSNPPKPQKELAEDIQQLPVYSSPA
jgi:plastocyanin